jgi:hypothetical protein
MTEDLVTSSAFVLPDDPVAVAPAPVRRDPWWKRAWKAIFG